MAEVLPGKMSVRRQRRAPILSEVYLVACNG
jgi:hypothetical protein